jgi:protein gp37
LDTWNPWHGCRKYSEGCQNCYVYRRDESIGKDASIIEKTGSFDLPVRWKRDGEYKLVSGSTIYTCLTSDFFIEEADQWRNEAWDMIRHRNDIPFFIITKRIARFMECIPSDWGEGYPNVTIGCTVENQKQCNFRLPIFNKVPIISKCIICEPLLENIELFEYLNLSIKNVVVGGESGEKARCCDYSWIMNIREQCLSKNVPFHFKQTGANFIKDGRHYAVPRQMQMAQAKRANIDT